MITAISIRKNNTVTYFNEYNNSLVYSLDRLKETKASYVNGKLDSLLLEEFAAHRWVTLNHLCQLAALIKEIHPTVLWNLEKQIFDLYCKRNSKVMIKKFNTRIPGSVDTYHAFCDWDRDWILIWDYNWYWKNKLEPVIDKMINNQG